ncbi:hypothetical protein O204_19215 [Pseudomonas simiae]|uniref:Uncharacterized protein n=1 Tax=Pseudomonas simiae TaxID=321846 RepID=U1UVX0_9PSED|nr:hypothetical protein O204_19215 [Pseudomonas simiae]
MGKLQGSFKIDRVTVGQHFAADARRFAQACRFK